MLGSWLAHSGEHTFPQILAGELDCCCQYILSVFFEVTGFVVEEMSANPHTGVTIVCQSFFQVKWCSVKKATRSAWNPNNHTGAFSSMSKFMHTSRHHTKR